MQQFLWFLGRFHVLVLHLPLGILTLAVFLEALVRLRRFAVLRPVLTPLWLAGALSAIVTVALGYLHASEDAFQGLAAVDAHRRAGVWLAVAACLGVALRIWGAALHERIWLVPTLAVVALMVLTGHLGGNLTHGDTYLVQYAPGPIRALAGLPPASATRPRPTDLASADIFLDVVHPALTQRCASCHNSSKRSGGLSVASFETLMEGGEAGVVIRPGDPAGSDLFHRVSIAPTSEEFMPRDGRTPLTAQEVAALGWWIGQGAPASAPVGSLEPPTEVAAALASILGLPGAAGSGAASEEALPEVAAAEQRALDRIVADGFVARKVAQDSNLLDVDYTSPVPLTPEAMAGLAALAPQILRLNLRAAGITDEQVKILEGFPNLRHLRLERNDITDAGAEVIATLTTLKSLNLTGTRITDTGFRMVASLPNLQDLYVWDTPVTPAAVKTVMTERDDLEVVAGLRAADVPPPEKIVPPDA